MYLDGEVMTAADDADPATNNEKANQRWFLLNYYPFFSQAAREAGIIPSIYFLTAGTEDKMLDNDFQVIYPAWLRAQLTNTFLPGLIPARA